MPDSTVMTPGRLAAKRMAQLATLELGSAAFSTLATCSGGLASMPPLTGSMMMTGLWCLRATS